jgi:hypothetical protein
MFTGRARFQGAKFQGLGQRQAVPHWPEAAHASRLGRDSHGTAQDFT